jgi:hypothetical protein
MDNLVVSELTKELTKLEDDDDSGNHAVNKPTSTSSRLKHKTIILLALALFLVGQGVREVVNSENVYQLLSLWINTTRTEDACRCDAKDQL